MSLLKCSKFIIFFVWICLFVRKHTTYWIIWMWLFLRQAENKHIQEINLSWNQLCGRGAVGVFKALEVSWLSGTTDLGPVFRKFIKSNQVVTVCKLTISLIVFPKPRFEYGIKSKITLAHALNLEQWLNCFWSANTN